MEHLSADQARRAALAAQGFSGSAKSPKRRPFDAALDRLHVLQLDSVNVFARSHYLPLFSRVGGYAPERLDAHLWESGEFTEYWAHEAALIRMADRPLFAWRMEGMRERYATKWDGERLAQPAARVLQRLRDEGPMTSGELEEETGRARGTWWDWSDTKHAVEMLFSTGEVAVATRRGFQRVYGLAQDVLPDHALGEVPREDAHRRLIEEAALRLGVGTLADLADYHRIKLTPARAAVRALVEEGVLVPVAVEGWTDGRGKPLRAWKHRDARVPSRLAPDALLTPFDPVTWFRPRAERIFDFHYRIEIYTPKPKRVYGYYCLPLMVGGRLAGRIDLKADRKSGVLRVPAAWQEPGAPARTSEAAQRLLAQAAAWQGLDTMVSDGVGNLPLPRTFAAGV
jgi:uncharacterized protein YcaQ